MNAIANYGAYQKNNYDNSVKERKDRETTRPERRGKAGSDDSQVKLSRGHPIKRKAGICCSQRRS